MKPELARYLVLTLLSSALLLSAGCGGETPESDREEIAGAVPEVRSTRPDTQAAPFTPGGAAGPAGEVGRPGSPAGAGAAGAEAAGRSTGRAPAGEGAAGGTETRTGDTGATATDGDEAPGRLYGNFRGTAEPSGVAKPESPVRTLQAIRTARHQNFDRIAFEFEQAVPGYRVAYIDRPVRKCGTDTVVDLPGDAWLAVQFDPAQSQRVETRRAVQYREEITDLPLLKEYAMVCDEAGNHTWVLGLAAPNRYRVFELTTPPRLVVDIKH